LSTAAVVDAVKDNDRRRRLHPTAAFVDNDRHGRRPPSPLPTLTAAAFDNDRHHRRE